VTRSTYKAGMAAERLAALVLRLKGYRILAHRYKTPVGEIDLIARRGRVLAFIEVKSRKNKAGALDSVTPHMQSRIERAAHYYIAGHKKAAAAEFRFDVFVVMPPFFWQHLDNAWRPRA